MKITRLEKSGDRGWFVGCFPEAAHQSDLAEVCYKIEPPGPIGAHKHTKCTEVMLIIKGSAKCQGQVFTNGDIFILEPGELNDTEYLEQTEVVCVKTPAGGNDKVLIDRNTI